MARTSGLAVPRRERIPPWSSWSYLRMARANSQWCRLSDTEAFVLGLLASRCDDRGRVRFARRRLLTLYGLEPGDVNPKPFVRALDDLRERGWLRVERTATPLPLTAAGRLATPRGSKPRGSKWK